jgi:aconitate decarboxylase
MADPSTERIAAWVVKLQPELLNKSVADAAVKSFANYVGCAIGGHPHEATQKTLAAYAALPQAPGKCSLLGSKRTADPLQAALINSVASHIHDYDDTHLSTVIHPTTAVASALLAYVESEGAAVSGPDFVTALFAGIEIQCLLGLAVYPSHYQRGWHITASVGSIGAAIAVGKAMKLTQEKMVNAIGIASTQVNGMRIHFGTHAKPLGAGFAAQAGLQSAYLARGGMNAAPNSIEGPRGWIECVCPDPQSAWDKLPKFLGALVSRIRSVGIHADCPR